MLNKNIPALCMLGLTLFASCAKEGPTGPTGNAGPSLTGSISGYVKLYDQYGSEVTTALQKTLLYLNSSGTPINPQTTGYYLFSNIGTIALVTGNYNISATDSAYASTIKNNIQLVTGNLNVDIKMSAIPDSFVYSFSALHNTGSANDSLVLSFKPDTRQRYCIVFASNTPAVGNLPTNYLWSQVLPIAPAATTTTCVVPGQNLTDVGMVSGASVYYAAYSYVVGDASVYEDISTGKNVYNAVSGAHADSTLVP